MIFPVPVTRNRFAAALYVLSLYFLFFAFGILSLTEKPLTGFVIDLS
jgi:hypothetical protein